MTRLATIEANLLLSTRPEVMVCHSAKRTRLRLSRIGTICFSVTDLATSEADSRYILRGLIVQKRSTRGLTTGVLFRPS